MANYNLSDEQQAQAKELGLTGSEMAIALATHIDPVLYAQHKAKIAVGDAAWEAKMTGVEDAAAERVAHFGPEKPADAK